MNRRLKAPVIDNPRAPGVVGALNDPPVFPFATVHTHALSELTKHPDRPPYKFTTINAPMGYGKTVLLSALYSHYAEHAGNCRWLGLDDRDASVERVLTVFEVRLGLSDEMTDPMGFLHERDGPLEDRIEALIRQLAQMPDPTTLFIDNLNYWDDARMPELIETLVSRSPDCVHLVAASTNMHQFNQAARLQLKGGSRQFGIKDLSLDEQGVRELLGSTLCASMSDGAIDTIVRRTEGWAGALRLVEIILKAAPAPEEALEQFSGADEDLAFLLGSQALRGFDEDFRCFLLKLSLLRDFDVDLAAAATGDNQAAAHIERLWKHNIFVIPLDRNRSRYRLHTLFREFLLDCGRRKLPAEERRAILSRAGLQCEQNNAWSDAIDYALLAQAWPVAASILERAAATFVRDRGDLSRYLQWVEQLHAAGERGGWETEYWYVWALVFHHRYEAARQQLAGLAGWLQKDAERDTPSIDPAAFGRRIDVIRIAIDVYTDRLHEARITAGRWLAPENRMEADDPFDVATVSCAAAIHDVSICRLVDARRMMRQAWSNVVQSRSAYGLAWVGIIDGLIALREGDYAAAYRDLTETLAKASEALGDSAGICGSICLLAARSALEIGETDQAAKLLQLGLRKASTHGLVDTTVHGLDVAIKLWPGHDTPTLSLTTLRRIAAAYPPRLSLMLSCFIARRLTQLGRLNEAELEATHIGMSGAQSETVCAGLADEPAYSLRDLAAATRIELLLASGKLTQAACLVAAETTRARVDGRVGDQVELALDEAVISQCSHNPAPAVKHLSRSISLAAKHHYLRPFRERSDLVSTLINDTRPKDWPFITEEERNFFAEICRGLDGANNDALGLKAELGGSQPLTDTPTSRELELLCLIEAGLSNQQIADRLSVSVATVKWHLYNLYGKLGAKNRAAAIARARTLNLMSR